MSRLASRFFQSGRYQIMDITLSKYAGFCDGVARAYEMMEKIAKDPDVKKPIAVLGSLVHNREVVARVEKMGIGKIEITEPIEELIGSLRGKIGTLVITAHGIGPKAYELIKKAGIDIIDTTCPRVIKVQRLAQAFFKRRAQIVIVGDCKHSEVKGINEWGNNSAFFIENEHDLESLSLDPARPVVVLSQTTQNEDFVRKAESVISQRYPNTDIMDSICMTTHDRQSEIKSLAASKDVMIIIGSPESANSTRLWQIAKSINDRSYFVFDSRDIKNEWFEDCKSIGISAGASTPEWIIDGVIKRLNEIA